MRSKRSPDDAPDERGRPDGLPGERGVKKNARLVQRRRGARRRSKLKLMFQLFVSLAFLGTAALLSAGIVKVVERPVAPWKTSEVEVVAPVAEAAPVPFDPSSGKVELEPVESAEFAAPIDPAHLELLIRETRVEDLAETRDPR
jgi:hypothetical protein